MRLKNVYGLLPGDDGYLRAAASFKKNADYYFWTSFAPISLTLENLCKKELWQTILPTGETIAHVLFGSFYAYQRNACGVCSEVERISEKIPLGDHELMRQKDYKGAMVAERVADVLQYDDGSFVGWDYRDPKGQLLIFKRIEKKHTIPVGFNRWDIRGKPTLAHLGYDRAEEWTVIHEALSRGISVALPWESPFWQLKDSAGRTPEEAYREDRVRLSLSTTEVAIDEIWELFEKKCEKELERWKNYEKSTSPPVPPGLQSDTGGG